MLAFKTVVNILNSFKYYEVLFLLLGFVLKNDGDICMMSVSAEIVMFEGMTCVYRSNVDLFFYVVGSSQENEVS